MVDRQLLFALQSGHCAAIHVSGIVPTGAGMFSPHFLQLIVKSHCRRVCGRLNTTVSIGEHTAKLQVCAHEGRPTEMRAIETILLSFD